MALPDHKEKLILSQFRSRVKDMKLEDDSDMFLIRWIRARNHDLTQAEEMLRKHFDWRREYEIDGILDWQPPTNIVADYPVDIVGYDLDNSPVGVLGFGKWDIRKFIERGQRPEFIRYVDQLYVRALDMMKGRVTREGIPVTQFVVIYDMDGLSMRTLTSYAALDTILETLKRFEANHPETMKRGYIVNATALFTTLFALVKPLLSQRTFGKIDVFGFNSNKWKPVLLEAIPSEILPRCLGGKNALSIINNSKGDNSTKFQRFNSMNPGFKSINVKAGEMIPLEFHVSTPNTILSWEFKTEDYDIGYSIVYEGKEEVVPYSRVESQIRGANGSVLCRHAGRYIVTFDNTYSRIRAKSVLYKISLSKKIIDDPTSMMY